MTCKECVHYVPCYEYGNILDPIHGGVKCDSFKSAADVAEVRHGEWKQVSEKYPRYVCSSCNHLFNNKEYKYCPNCGAKMDGGAKG